MSEFDKLYRKIITEMAKPVTILNFDADLNSAYGECLKIMRKYGETNAPTFAVWDYIWRCLPDEIKSIYGEEKQSHSSPTLKFFIIELLKNKLDSKSRVQLIDDLRDDQKIRSYVNRPLSDRGSRAKGVARQSRLSPWSLDDVSSI